MMYKTRTIFLCLMLAAQALAAQSRPNIILFLVDDMGWQDTSVPFWKQLTALNKRYRTPNMERLAREGMKFSNAYATPVCTPTRVSLMTGMNVARHHVSNWTSPQKDKRSDYPDSLLQAVDWNMNGVSPVKGVPNTVYATPLPELLRQAGYYTIHCGKAHFASAGTPGADPRNMGFTVNIGGHAAGHPGSYLPEKRYGNQGPQATKYGVPGLEKYYGKNLFLSEALTQEALQALEAPVQQKQPFFLYMAHYAVHVPLEVDKRYYQRYLDAGLDSSEAKYATLLEGMDKSLGDLLDFLDQRGLAENTVVLFMSDNGGLSLAPPRGGRMHTQNAPLRAGKGAVYEGGIREPMLVRWPGVVKAGAVNDQYLIIEDFFPTLLEIGGVKLSRTPQQVDGQSFVPLLKNASLRDSARTLVWHYPHRWIPRGDGDLSWAGAIRQGSWKLVWHYATQKTELYNLAEDIGETHDLSARYPDKAKALQKLLRDYLKARQAPLPEPKSM
jgi:arylsulfatase A-like enzyme